MSSSINTSKLAEVFAESYNKEELEIFLSDYFGVSLEDIIVSSGVSFQKIVREVIGYFVRRGYLADLVRELGRDRPGKIDILDLLMPPSTQPLPSPVTSSTMVDIDPDEVDFYFVIEPDRRIVPATTTHKSAKQAIYVRIPAVSGSLSTPSTSPQALALALDRSGSMQGYKTDVAHAAADYLLDIAQGPNHRVSVIAFDEYIEVPIPLQPITNPAPNKSILRRIAPRGQTDLFAAWQKAVDTLRTLNDTWDRRVVLITDGLITHGMADPATFEKRVAAAWKTEKIATTCISMGSEWNVDLLNMLASAGGGSLHFIGTVSQAEQALHEAFHSRSGVVARNLRVEMEPLDSAHISQVNGIPTSLSAGKVATFSLANQLLTNVEEQLVLRLEFPPPTTGQKKELLRCTIFYETPSSAQTRKTPDKILHIFGEVPDAASCPAIVNQGVTSTAYTTLSRELFRQSLGAYLRQNSEMGNALLAQAKFALQSTPKIPRGYQPIVNLQERRIRDLERFQGHVPPEYIKQKYIEELSHRDVIWDKLSQLLDRLFASSSNVRFVKEPREQFEWANRMIGEYTSQLPISFDRTTTIFEGQVDDQGDRSQRENILSAKEFWLNLMFREVSREEGQREPISRQNEYQMDRASVIALLTGACFGLERTRQGTREEILELMESYLELRYGIHLSIVP
jgi:uncharacterized protein YegL